MFDILPSGDRDNAGIPVGLDFGTTNTVLSNFASNMRRKGAFVFELPTVGQDYYPSMVYQEDKNNLLTGVAAYINRLIYPELVARSPKKHIGNSSYKYYLGEKVYSPVDIASEVIKGIFREVISTDLGFCPSILVATVPYHFKNIQNTNIQQSIILALTELYNSAYLNMLGIRLVPEPIAATIYYIYKNRDKNVSNKILLTYDIGGGTLDFTLVRYSINRSNISFEVLGSEGIDNFGGDDFDELIYSFIIEYNGIDLTKFSQKEKTIFNAKLTDEIINAKHRLSWVTKTHIIVPNLPVVGYINCQVSRGDFEKLLFGQLNSPRNMVQEFRDRIFFLAKKSGVDISDVEALLPIGGASQVPIFLSAAKNICVNAQGLANENEELFSSVSKGAAIYAAILSDKLLGTSYKPFGSNITDIDISSKIPHAILLEKYNRDLEVVIPENAVCPYSAKVQFLPTSLDNNKRCVDLGKIKVFQGNRTSMNLMNDSQLIGYIDFSDHEIYAHNRKLSEIIIELSIDADETIISFSVKVCGANKDKTDLIFKKKLSIS